MRPKPNIQNPRSHVAVLTGGGDRPYVFGLTRSLMSQGASLDIIGSDDLDLPEFRDRPTVKYFNLRGSHRTDVSLFKKIFRILLYYAKLIRYASTAKPGIFHILWNNKFETFDRTLLMSYYKSLGKKLVLTAHNVNAGKRDLNDSRLNRFTLRIQYRLADHIFVHTEKMKLELIKDFDVSAARITVIPFGINNSVPNTSLTANDAKQRLGVRAGMKTLLFYGRIAPSKGLEYLTTAFHQILRQHDDYQLIIAGRPDRCEEYWAALQETIREDVRRGRILLRAEFIPDEETEIYFKAADVLVLPYKDIFQSGVMFLGYNFGLPVLAADVGSLKDDIVEGKTGHIFRPGDPDDLARAIEQYFASDLFAALNIHRQEIRDYAVERHSWDIVGQIIISVYGALEHAGGVAAFA